MTTSTDVRRTIATAAAVVLATAAGTAAAAPRSATDARVVVYNLIENNRPSCPIIRWKFVKVTQGTFRGISHPGRGKLLWKVTAQIQWAGTGFFLHQVSWTIVGKQALAADMNPSTSAVYRDRETTWIAGGCIGDPPFS